MALLEFTKKNDFELEAKIQKMLSELHHRGPDDRGHSVNEDFAIGMTRLSIIDLDTEETTYQMIADTIWFVMVKYIIM